MPESQESAASVPPCPLCDEPRSRCTCARFTGEDKADVCKGCGGTWGQHLAYRSLCLTEEVHRGR
jgi:hypothetical protein